MRFEDKTVIITGGASGIGLLCGKCFCREGANVLLTDVDEGHLEEAVAGIASEGGSVRGIRCDVREYEQVQHACDEAVRLWGGIDILINCAGGSSSRIFGCTEHFSKYPVEYLDWGIDVNLKGPIYFPERPWAR